MAACADCAFMPKKSRFAGNDAIVAAPAPPHIQMMGALRDLEDKLQRLDDRLCGLAADAAGSSAELARKMDDISACLVELGLGPGEGAEEGAPGRCLSPPLAVDPVAAPDFVATSLTALQLPAGGGGGRGEGAAAAGAAGEVLRIDFHSSAVRLLQQTEDLSLPVKRLNQVTEVVALVAIAVNTVLLMVELQCEGQALGARLGLTSGGPWLDMRALFVAMEHIFNIIFIFELVVRVATYKKRFFYNMRFMKFNIFDFTLIFATSLDLYLFRALGGDSSRFVILRLVRFVRLARVFRMFGALKFFMPLRLMVSVLSHSAAAMFWAMMLLWVVMLTAAILMCLSAQFHMKEYEDLPPETRQWVFDNYGTTVRSIWTLVQITFSGGWPNYAHRMVQEVNSGYAIFFFIYVFAVIFCLFRVVTARLVQDTMEHAGRDAQLAVQQEMAQKEHMSQRLLDFFVAADTSGDGLLTRQEFQRILENEKVKTWLNLMGLSLHETEELFTLLAGSDGMVCFQEFSRGIRRLKGPARSEDLMVIKADTQQLQNMTRREFDSVHRTLEELRGALAPARISRLKGTSVAASRLQTQR